MQTINWAEVENKAKGMTETALRYAVADCRATAETMGAGQYQGKDAAYYADEASVYQRELDRRAARAAKPVKLSSWQVAAVVDSVMRNERLEPVCKAALLQLLDNAHSITVR